MSKLPSSVLSTANRCALVPKSVRRLEKSYILNFTSVDAEAVSEIIAVCDPVRSIPIELGIIVYLLYRVLTTSVWANADWLLLCLTSATLRSCCCTGHQF